MAKSSELSLNPTKVLASAAALLAVAIPAAALLALLVDRNTDAPMVYVAAAVLGSCLAIVVFLRPQVGAYLLIASIVTNVSAVVADVNKPLVALLAVGLTLNCLFRRRCLRPLTAVEGLMLIYWGIWLASYFVAVDQGQVLSIVADFAKDLLILFLVVNALETRENLKRAVWVVIGATGLLAALGAYQVITSNYGQVFGGFARVKVTPVVSGLYSTTLTGPIGDANFYGQILAAVLPLAVYRLLAERNKWRRITAGAIALLIVYAALHTYSRGTSIVIALFALAVVVERRVRLRLLLPAAILLVAAVPLLPVGYLDRLGTLSWLFGGNEAGVYQEESFRGRWSEALAGVTMFAENPLLGVGAGNSTLRYQEYASGQGLEYRATERESHSMYIEAAAETGLPGIAVLIAIFAVLLARLERARQRALAAGDAEWSLWLLALEFSVGCYLTTSLILHRDFIRYLWLLVTLAIAALHVSTAELFPSRAPSRS